MISLKGSITEYERFECLSAEAQDLLVSTLESVRQYAVETDPASIEQLRSNLAGTIKRVRNCMDSRDPGGLNKLHVEVRGELRDYHDRAARYLDHLRAELSSTGKVLSELLTTCQSNTGAEQKLSEQAVQVRGLESARSLDDVRVNARRIAITITQCAEQLKREKDGVIVQLRDEIRTLQRTVEDAQRAARVDDVTGSYNREDLERSIRREIVARRPITVLHIWLRNFEALRDSQSVGIMDRLVVAISKRLLEAAKDAVLGRWRNDVFCLVSASAASRDLGSDVLRQCAGTYVCSHQNVSRTLKVQLAVTHLDPREDDDDDSFIQRIDGVNEKQRE